MPQVKDILPKRGGRNDDGRQIQRTEKLKTADGKTLSYSFDATNYNVETGKVNLAELLASPLSAGGIMGEIGGKKVLLLGGGHENNKGVPTATKREIAPGVFAVDYKDFHKAHPDIGKNTTDPRVPFALATGGLLGVTAPAMLAGAGAEAGGTGGVVSGSGVGGGAGGVIPGGATGATGALSAADVAGLTQMGQAAGLSGSALESFVASGGALGSAAAGGGGVAGGSSILSKLLPTGSLSSSIVPIAGQVISGILGSNAAGDAADAQIAASQAGIGEARRQYDQTRADFEPWRQAGSAAMKRLDTLLQPGGDLSRRFSAADLEADPVYQSGLEFGLNEGRNAINARAVAGGGYDSGATLKALTRYGNDYGSTKANESYNRFNTDMTNLYNRNAGVAGMGQTATGTVASAGQNTSNNIINATSDMGNSRAASIVGGANSWANSIGGINNIYQNAEDRKILEALLRKR
jgi:hypothetical protein